MARENNVACEALVVAALTQLDELVDRYNATEKGSYTEIIARRGINRAMLAHLPRIDEIKAQIAEVASLKAMSLDDDPFLLDDRGFPDPDEMYRKPLERLRDALGEDTT